jgi:sortase A
VLRWIERLLVTAGASMLIWCAIVVADASLSQWTARRSLETAAQIQGRNRPRWRDEAAGGLTAPIVRTGSAIATLSIPRLRMSAVVLHGSDEFTLRHGPGHLEHRALPGESGNMVIAGHRDTFFRALRRVRVGDDVFVDAPQGSFHYRVDSTRVVDRHTVSALEPTNEDALTLITCYPFWALGPAPDRFVVRATRVPDVAVVGFVVPPTLPEPVTPPPAPQSAADDPVSRHSVSDEELVRRTIERFRRTYTEQPIRDACNIAITGHQAVAVCQARTFTLEHAPGEWAIKSIERH